MKNNTLLAVSIRDGQYKGNKNLKEVEIPEGVVSIGKKAFKDSSLKSIIMPDSVRMLGKQVFCYCFKLESIGLSNSIKEIPTDAFYYCTRLKKLQLPPYVERINTRAFNGCTNLKDVVLNDKLKRIDGYAFSKCRSLESIVIPDSVTYMEWYVFEECDSLKEVIFSNSIKEIGDSTFKKCYNLEKVFIPGPVTKIHRNAFKECRKVVVYCYENSPVIKQLQKRGIRYKVIPRAYDIENGNKNFVNISNPLEKYNALILNRNNLKKINIPEGIKLIGKNEFSRCEKLEEVVIPESVKIVDTGAFLNCKNLKKLLILNPHISMEEAVFLQNKGICVYCRENSDFVNMLDKNNVKYEIIDKKEKVEEEPELLKKFTQTMINSIKTMLEKGISIEMIAKEFSYSVDEIRALANYINKLNP